MSARRGCRLAGGEFFAQGGENLCIGLGYVGGKGGWGLDGGCRIFNKSKESLRNFG